MNPDLVWQVQAASWTIAWVALGLTARELVARNDERRRRQGRHE